MIPVLALAAALLAPPQHVPGQPYSRLRCADRFGREVTFYLSEASGGADAELPLVVHVQGSGCASLFAKNGSRIAPTQGHASLVDAVAGRARVLIVEKPGVEFLDAPERPDAGACSETFRQEHVLERWSAAVGAALEAASAMPGVRRGGGLAMGHSEGGLVACRVAKEHPDLVTHVGVLAGGGASQLASLVSLAREGDMLRAVSDDSEARVARLLRDWDAVLADPGSSERLFLGHPHRRWTSFLASSPMEELAGTKDRVFIAQGLDDRAVDVASADMLHAHLRSRGVDATILRVPGGDHSFHAASAPGEDGWRKVLDQVVAWWLAR